MLISINPANNKKLQTYNEMSLEEVQEIISLAQKDFINWKNTSFSERSKKMYSAAEILKEQKEKLAEIITMEMGKPILQSVAEVEKCAWVCEYYAKNSEAFLSDLIIPTSASESFVSFNPLGVVLAVMPWNFPFWQVFRFAAPNLMAGNAAVLKHSSNVCGCALAIEKIFKDAGFPKNLFRTLLISSSKVESVIKNNFVKAVTLTGSTEAGKSVAQLAGKYLKKTVLELGGSDPYIILPDADLDLATETCVNARLLNGGQSCIAAKRFIVVESIYNEFEKVFLEKMSSKKMGDPFDKTNDLGPQAREELKLELHQQVLKSIENGAKLLLGGFLPELNGGAYYPPTVLTDVTKGMPAYDEEIFGPVASLIKVKDENEAIATANDTSFGLGAAIFTRDIDKGKTIAKNQLNAGCCFVNEFVKSDPRLPFGGINQSGYGRELSDFGIKEFVNIKTVYIK